LNVALAAARPGFLALAPTARFIPMRQGPGLRESAAFSFYKPISFFGTVHKSLRRRESSFTNYETDR
jgi:hypothetical protein